MGKYTNKIIKTLTAGAIVLSISVSASSIFKADGLFKDKKYDLAKLEYEAATKVGSPHAYYQLGTIFLQGLGETKQDISKALIYFSLAAEYEFSDALSVVDKIITALPEDKQEHAKSLVKGYQQHFGRNKVQSQYFPALINENLTKKIEFGGSYKLDDISLDDDFLPDLSIDDDISLDNFADTFANDDFGDNFGDELPTNENLLNDSAAQAQAQAQAKRAVMTIIDSDIAPDGSLRNSKAIQSMGDTKRILYNVSISGTAVPTFNETHVNFVQRTNSGIAQYDRFEMQDKHPQLLSRLKRISKKNKERDDLESKYRYAMGLVMFEFLPQEEGEGLQALKEAAEAGHPKAQYEYGMYLYREQLDIAKAVHWISEASKYGLIQAEYRLANLLQSSPWVVPDDKKALYWYESAAKKGDLTSMRKAAEIKLTSNNPELIDVDVAIAYLNTLATKQNDNPEYRYLQAIAHVKMKPRKLSHAVTFIREAIDLAQDLNWDVTKWEAQLSSWTGGGRVTIQDKE